jgi:CelD/BcsL family acetyltransferase involved in cellulose biosynthesis
MSASRVSKPFSRIIVANSFDVPGYPRFLEEWDNLAHAMPTRMPFQTAHWNKTWWNHFKRRRLFLRDDLHLVCAIRDDRIVGIVPLFKTTIGLPKFPIFRYLKLLGADGNLTEWRSVICREEDRKAMQALWIKEALKFRFGFCLFHFRGFTAEELETAEFEKIGFTRKLTPCNENFVLTLTDSWESFKTKLKRNIKESLRHCYNSLKHADLKLSMNVIDDADVLRSKLALFYHWHTIRANNKDTVTHPDYFSKELHRDFIESLAKGMCPQGQMKLFELRLNDQPVAYRLGFVTGDSLYFYFSGYDPAYSKFSVMTTLVAEMIKWAIDQKLKFANLSFGRDNSKIRWGPVEVQTHDAIVGTNGVWLLDTFRRAVNDARIVFNRYKKRNRMSTGPA